MDGQLMNRLLFSTELMNRLVHTYHRQQQAPSGCEVMSLNRFALSDKRPRKLNILINDLLMSRIIVASLMNSKLKVRIAQIGPQTVSNNRHTCLRVSVPQCSGRPLEGSMPSGSDGASPRRSTET